MDHKNYYEMLEISVSASAQDIEKAYVRAKNAYSGDSAALYSLMSADDCQAVLQQIEEAYSVLGFPEKRREYDRVRGLNQTSRNPFEDTASIANPVSWSAPESSLVEEKEPSVSERQFEYQGHGSIQHEAKVSKVQALKKFGLDYVPDLAMEQKIEQATEFNGPFLKEVREYRGVTMERLVDMTRISKTYLTAIETDDIKKLPADAYTRGFVSQYAKVIKLNPELVATSYLHYIKRLKGAK
jgi:curved DNA-binding protein CbpA